MANTDKDILITPNRGSSNEPKIEFKGASSIVGPSTITATIYPTNNGTLSFDGTEGSLFSIANNLTTGSIFSVNPISGIPIIDVNADRTIALNPYGGNTGIGLTNPSYKLDVNGTVGIKNVLGISESGGSGNRLLISSSGSGAVFNQNDNSNILFQTQGATRFTIAHDTGNITATGSVSAAGASGFYSTTYASNVRNPIWRFANADGYGFSYFQGSSGVGGDTLGFHFGTATAAASLLQLNGGTGIAVNGTTDNISANESGTSNYWRARILSKNSGADKSAFLGVYASSPGVFAHNHALNAWATLYVNTTNGSSDGGNVTIAGSSNVGIGILVPTTKLDVIGNSRIGGAATRSTSGLTVGYTNNTTFAANTDIGDGLRTLSLINESSTTNVMAALGFRVNPDGGSANAMLDMKFVQTGATNTSSLYYTFNHGGSFKDRFLFKSDGTFGVGTVIREVPYDTLNNGTLSWEGSAGQLFSITNNLTSGSIFSVNDVSGIPSIDVDANGTIKLAPYNGNVGVGTLTPAAKLDVNGTSRFNGQITATGNILMGTGTSGPVTTPSYLSLGTNYTNTYVRANCKIRLYDNGADVYGFNIGPAGDVQYHSTTTHQFYNSDAATFTINSTGAASAGTVQGTRLISTSDLQASANSTINGISIGKGSGSVSDNTAIGYNALALNTTGNYNTAIGKQALLLNDTGYSNTATGSGALYSNTIGYLNTAIGESALFFNTGGFENAAIGTAALISNTNGIDNTAIGHRALFSNTDGVYNTATGAYALYSITIGYDNTANGYNALRYNTTGVFNTATGSGALFLNSASYNTATGAGALYANSTGSQNTATGAGALGANSTGDQNTANGRDSLRNNTTGFENTATGQSSLYYNVTGNQNTANGVRALYSNTGPRNSAFGTSALENVTTGSNNTAVGWYAGTDAVANITTQSNYVVLGNNSTTNANIKVAWTYTSDARDKTNIGDVELGLDFVSQLRPVKYQYRKSRHNPEPQIGARFRYGFLAQDILPLEGNEPIIIDDSDETNLKYNESCLIPILVNAIKELKQRLDAAGIS